MAAAAANSAIRQERALLDYLSATAKSRTPRRAIHIELSRLQPYNRQPHHRRAAAYRLAPLSGEFDGAQFEIFNGDLVLICAPHEPAQLETTVAETCSLFANDPLIGGDAGRAVELLVRRYDLPGEHEALTEAATALLRAREQAEADAADRAPEAPRRPLDAKVLGALQQAIEQADLSSMMIRQPVCALMPQQAPKPIFHELFVSIGDLARAVLPDRDILANPWLFQELTRTLDRRVMAHLARQRGDGQRSAFSLNLNIETLLSPEFIRFDQTLHALSKATTVVELQLVDIVSDINRYFFARDFLKGLGYRICLDGLNFLSLPVVNRGVLGVDLVKLVWSQDLSDFLAGPRGGQLRDAVAAFGRERIILCRCSGAQAIADGRDLGLLLYQGHRIDSLLSQGPAAEDKARSMGEAIQRHRVERRPVAERLWE